LSSSAETWAQSFGVELLNNVMPASGGMAGASIASPQDLQSAINGNPATLTQYRGTQFGFGGAWIEPTYNLSVGQPGLPLIGVSPFQEAKSDAQGIAAANVGVTQDYAAFDLPITTGLALVAGAGAGVDFRDIPEARGTHANLVALDIVAGAGVELTDRWSLGASMLLSTATMDGPFVGISGSSTDYALRGSVGLGYELYPDTNLGFYWKSRAGYTFENLARFQTPGPLLPTRSFDVSVDRPQIAGLGISNTSFMEGRLLLAADAVYQAYTETDLFGAIFKDQWSLQFGAQLSPNDRVRLRLGYAWNENPMRDAVGDRIGGVLPPGGAAHVQYIEALFAAIPQHRITFGVGVLDVLPGVDFDLFAGGMFEESQTFGITTATVESYWIGSGITWRFGARERRCVDCR
jgi:long-chain fatty acid transport protein